MKVYLVYGSIPYEGLGYPSVHATYESALANATRSLGYTFEDEHSAITVRKDELDTIVFTKLFNLNFDRPQDGLNWSESSSINISESEVRE